MPAAHKVKCYYCGEIFDTNKEEYVMPNSRRYAHKKCAEDENSEQKKIIDARDKLYEYVAKLLNLDFVGPKNILLIEQYIKKYNYSYGGMLKTLIYCYEIKNKNMDKEKCMAMIPYCYEDARKYYHDLRLIQQNNASKNIKDYIGKEKEIVIPIPKVEKPKRKIFMFLDEE